jgi:hypothetical protein
MWESTASGKKRQDFAEQESRKASRMTARQLEVI